MPVIKDRRAGDKNSADTAAMAEGEAIGFGELSFEEAKNKFNCRRLILRSITVTAVIGIGLGSIAFFVFAFIWLFHLGMPEGSSYLWLSPHQFSLIQTGLCSSVFSVFVSNSLKQLLVIKQ